MKSKILFGELNTYLILGIKFGIVGSMISLIFHVLLLTNPSNWGNLELETVEYTIFNGFFIGFFIGIFEFIFSNSKVGRLPYSLILLFRSITYFLIILISVYSVTEFYLNTIGIELMSLSDDPQKIEQIKNVFFPMNLNVMYVMVFTLVATFIWQLKSFFGKGVLINYLIGKYYKPSIEERIFMFLDLNDATKLAEKLGSKKYSSFLSDFFKDLDLAFTKTKGKVFQYVGDEVVIIWNPKNGLKDNNCINAYFLALNILENKKDYYLDKYKLFPSFKAALHLGDVTITEIGVSKKEIVYHGDTINTASRICSSAHKLGKNILISKSLHDKLVTDIDIIFEDLGEHFLKGKDEKIHIYGI